MIKKIYNTFKKVLLPSLILSLLWINNAFAQYNLAQKEQELKTKLEKIFRFVFSSAGIIFIVIFIVGGIMYLTSGGNEESSMKAKRLLINAVIGIILVVGGYAIAAWILRGIGVTQLPNVITPTP